MAGVLVGMLPLMLAVGLGLLLLVMPLMWLAGRDLGYVPRHGAGARREEVTGYGK